MCTTNSTADWSARQKNQMHTCVQILKAMMILIKKENAKLIEKNNTSIKETENNKFVKICCKYKLLHNLIWTRVFGGLTVLTSEFQIQDM